jgi:hypothetical protein
MRCPWCGPRRLPPLATQSGAAQGSRNRSTSGRHALQPLRFPDEGACGDHRSTLPPRCSALPAAEAMLPFQRNSVAHSPIRAPTLANSSGPDGGSKVPRGRQMPIRPCASAVLSWKTPTLRGGRISPPFRPAHRLGSGEGDARGRRAAEPGVRRAGAPAAPPPLVPRARVRYCRSPARAPK